MESFSGLSRTLKDCLQSKLSFSSWAALPSRCNSTLWGKLSWAAVFENERKRKTVTQLHEGLPVCYCGYFYLRRIQCRDTVGNTNQPTQADSEKSDCQEVCSTPPLTAPTPWCYNTQMDRHIGFRCIGYYTLGLLFPYGGIKFDDSSRSLSSMFHICVIKDNCFDLGSDLKDATLGKDF